MSSNTVEDRSEGTGLRVGYLGSGIRFDRVMSLLSVWMIGGIYLDGWAHNHLSSLETFFTPWHGVLYSGFFVLLGTMLFVVVRNRRRGTAWRHSLPAGYLLSLLGAGIFLVGGVLDVLWHLAFGIERDAEALLSPTHLTLAVGVALMVTGPLRASWIRLRDPIGLVTRDRPTTRRAWAEHFPTLVSLTLVLSLLTFFTQFAHPLVDTWATAKDAPEVTNAQIYSVRLDGSALTRLTEDSRASNEQPVWSPNGDRIAHTSTRDHVSQIFVMNADGTAKRQITPGTARHYTPRWSPDGRTIAMGSSPDGDVRNSEIYVMPADGGELTPLTSAHGGDLAPVWSPEGARIAFTSSGRTSQFAIHVMNSDGSGVKRLTAGDAPNYMTSWSADGQRLAFTSERDGHPEVYVMNVDGTGQTRLTFDSRGSFNPAWSPDGQLIVFLANRGMGTTVRAMKVDGSGERDLAHTDGMDAFAAAPVSWSPDGSRVVFSLQGRPSTPGWLTILLGLASILLQVIIFMAVILFAVRHWTLPLGGITLMLGLNGILMSIIQDKYSLIPAAIATGVAGDLMYRALRPSAERPGSFRLIAVTVPLVYEGLYFLSLALTDGIGWSIHLWAGSMAMAGLVGLLLSFAFVPMTPGASPLALGLDLSKDRPVGDYVVLSDR